MSRRDSNDGPPPVPGEPEVVVLPDATAAATAAADRIASGLADAIGARGVADWMTTGGSGPPAIYRALTEPDRRDRVTWDLVRLWWGDDRFVPRADRLSNVRPVDELLLASGTGVRIPPGSVHPVPTDEALARGGDNAWAAERYTAMVTELVPANPVGWPAFDVALIGIGPDGHLLSVFPGSSAWDQVAVALPVPAPTHVEPHVDRVTLHPAVLDAVGELLVVITGDPKAEVVARILEGPRDERRLPGQRARRAGATWLLDRAAAAQLTG